MKLTVYEYSKCGTCRNALKSLKAKGHELITVPVFEQPPTVDELRDLIAKSGHELKKFFNTSGEVYKEMGLKDKLAAMSEDEKLALLASNGRLIKRPIATDGTKVTVGFKETDYEAAWGQNT
ncbi:arsenate reductase family protein [Paenibacillus sp. N1-5-1-14]|uniref:arsenate reductase family protein n=1 Tax=Paenibacillus radicibacter TaxID=2972488 RepID=UPI0021597592|nr:arsenate reductase family protein [Paenibacillus radicibacter]MCR8644888.1 arsenate reductase family protein [Paenibacillus radicibacter]